MSAAVEDMYLYSSAIKMDRPKQYRKRQHSESSDDDVSSPKSASPSMDDDRRAHHNELERRRRDHIKDHFVILKEAIPLLDGEKSSRALILKRAVEYIKVMQSRLSENQTSIDELRRKNELLEDKLHDRESSVSPSASRLPSLGAAPMQMPQLSMPVSIAPIPQIPQFPQNANPIALSTMDPVQLNSLIASSHDAIMALTQTLLGKIQSPGLPDTSVSPPAGLYPTAFSPGDQQMAVKF
uniref:BHLH domain-containing protein n=1 Tax=Caenorhabditis japonica TaxID=281687 RepID=A0A8R1I3N2_CAEJA